MKTVSAVGSTFLALQLLLAGCGRETGPWVAFDGGGFVFNYRIAEASYGFNVKPLRRLPEGAVLEAEFEDPGGGKPIFVREVVTGPALRYMFQTPPLTGIKAAKPYRAVIRVMAPGGDTILASYERKFVSDVDQSWLPDKPLVVGPGYAPNPDLQRN